MLPFAKYASEFSPTLVTKDGLTVLGMGDVTKEMVEAKQPLAFAVAPRHLHRWDGSGMSSQSRVTAWKSRELPSPTV